MFKKKLLRLFFQKENRLTTTNKIIETKTKLDNKITKVVVYKTD